MAIPRDVVVIVKLAMYTFYNLICISWRHPFISFALSLVNYYITKCNGFTGKKCL
jgi:hypothetical protein